jgi:hypothetical protein
LEKSKYQRLELVQVSASSYKWPKFAPISLQKCSCSAATLRFLRLIGANFSSFSPSNQNPEQVLEIIPNRLYLLDGQKMGMGDAIPPFCIQQTNALFLIGVKTILRQYRRHLGVFEDIKVCYFDPAIHPAYMGS